MFNSSFCIECGPHRHRLGLKRVSIASTSCLKTISRHSIDTRLTRSCNRLLLGVNDYALWRMKSLRRREMEIRRILHPVGKIHRAAKPVGDLRHLFEAEELRVEDVPVSVHVEVGALVQFERVLATSPSRSLM